MQRVPRVLLTAAGAAIIAIVTSVGASAAGFLGPGHTSSNFADANASWYTTSPYVQVSVDRNTFVFRPSHHGGSPLMQHATILFVSVQTDTLTGQDCFIIPDSAFVQSNGVQNASVSVTVDATNLCPGFATKISGVIGDAGGGPPPGLNLPFPVTVNMAWTGNGVTSSFSDNSRSSCGGFSSVNQTSQKSAIANATGTITLGDGTALSLSNPDFATSDAGTFQSDLQGTPNPLCYGI
jgi:hypothetical protein